MRAIGWELVGVFCTLFVTIFLAVFLIDGIQVNLIEEQMEHEFYCEMVSLWESDSHLPPQERRGWPPYKGGCDGY